MEIEKQFELIRNQIKVEARQKAESKGAMSGYEIISELRQYDKNKNVIIRLKVNEYDKDYNIIGHSFRDTNSDFICESWRGSYDLPSISYDEISVSVDKAIKNLQECHKKEVTGYKGGDFILSLNDIIYIANYGESNDSTAITKIFEENENIICLTDTDMY